VDVKDTERCIYDRVIDKHDRYAIHPRRCTKRAVCLGMCKAHAKKTGRIKYAKPEEE
jgi:hypothetical protein